MRESEPLGLAVVGYGYWGPNIVRNVVDSTDFDLVAVCEVDGGRAAAFSQSYPDIRVERSLHRLLADPRVDAVSIATPPKSHFELAHAALEAGKHVLVEKPLATSVAEAE